MNKAYKTFMLISACVLSIIVMSSSHVITRQNAQDQLLDKDSDIRVIGTIKTINKVTTDSYKNSFAIDTDSIYQIVKHKIPKSYSQKKAKISYSLNKNMKSRISYFSKICNIKDYGVYIKDLKSGITYEYNAHKKVYEKQINGYEGYFNGASVAKLYVCFAAYKLAHLKIINLDTILEDKYTGIRYNLRDEIRRAIRYSNNDSYNRIIRAIGPHNINEVLRAYRITNNVVYGELGPGLAYTYIKTNLERYGYNKNAATKLNPAGAGKILEIAYWESSNGDRLMTSFIDNLKNNIYNGRIPQGIGFKYPVAHKTGTIEEYGVCHDAGIVFADKRPYIVVVFITGALNGKTLPNTFIRYIAGESDKQLPSN